MSLFLFEKLTHLVRIFAFIFGISLAIVKTDVKNIWLKSIFSITGQPFFRFLICAICLRSANCFFKENRKLSIAFWVFGWPVLWLEFKCWCFVIPLNLFKCIRRDSLLSLQTLELVQIETEWAHTQIFLRGIESEQ